MIYEQAASNEQGEGGTPSPIKPGEVEGEEEAGRKAFTNRGTVQERKVGGKLMRDKTEWLHLNENGMPLQCSTIKPPSRAEG